MEKKSLSLVEVRFWQSEAESCIERQKIELIQRNNYPFLVNYFEGIEKIDPAYPHVATEQKMAIINEYFPNTNSLISEIMFQNPDILLESRNPQSEEDMPLMKAALNYLWDKAEGLVENRVALFDMLYAGYCAVEVDLIPDVKEYQDPQEESVEQKPKGIFEKLAEQFKNPKNAEDAELALAKMSPPMEASYATAQKTYIRRYDPLDVPLDWRAERVKDRRYNLKKVWLSKAEFDCKYPDFKDKVNVTDDKFEYSKHSIQMHNRKILLYEFQVRMRQEKYTTIVISPNYNMTEIDSFIRPYKTNGFNMKIGSLHKYGKLYPRSFAQINKTMQDEMNNYVRHLMEVAERNIPKYTYDKNKVKEDALQALTSTKVNDLVGIDGNTSGAVTPLQPTTTSYENKELLSVFQDQKTKLWAVAESRIGGLSQNKFAIDTKIADAGFQSRNIDIQEGLRLIIQDQLDTGKDIIATFWDEAIFLKLTGHSKMDWYEPQTAPDPNNPDKQIVLNPLTDILTADYDVKIDIASAGRKNRDQQLQMMSAFMQQIVAIRPILNAQGQDINVDEIRKIAKEFGWNPEKVFIPFQSAQQMTVPTATGETITPEDNAARQAEAEARLAGAT